MKHRTPREHNTRKAPAGPTRARCPEGGEQSNGPALRASLHPAGSMPRACPDASPAAWAVPTGRRHEDSGEHGARPVTNAYLLSHTQAHLSIGPPTAWSKHQSPPRSSSPGRRFALRGSPSCSKEMREARNQSWNQSDRGSLKVLCTDLSIFQFTPNSDIRCT